MLGVSGMLGNSGDGSAAAAAAEAEAVFRESAGNGGRGGGGHVVLGVAPSSGGVVVMSEEERARIEDGDRNSGGTRWPRQETLALLKIRSDMDVAFRDASLKGPLWEDVSRKLAELGYQRSAKKCKEKFENVYKYHRRTKEGRSSKHEGKTYRFFDQLEALETPPTPFPSLNPQQRPQTHPAPPAAAVASQMPVTSNPPFVSPISTSTTVPSTANPTNSSAFNPLLLSTPPPQPLPPPAVVLPATAVENPNPINFSYSNSNHNIPSSYPNMSVNVGSISSPSSTSSDEEPERRGSRKRKYWSEFFQRLMNEVIVKQEEMQKRLLETLEKREHERVAREEAWRVQEMSRMNREHDRLVQERSLASAKDAAVIAFLQKVSEQEIPNGPQMQMHMKMQVPAQPQANPAPPAAPPVVVQPPVQAQPSQQHVLLQTPPPPPSPSPLPQPQVQVQVQVQPPVKGHDNQKTNNGGENFLPASSSRWPKAEVEALIRLRTNMDTKYQENGPKGPLWEEISAAMRKIGYDRNAKRCKEKWENINKYFKKVKESNKKRPEDSKTCPYFHQLDALYREKTNSTEISTNSFSPGFNMKLENPMAAPIMVQPEQQWPLQQEQHQHQHQLVSGILEDEHDSENTENDEMSEEDEAGGYEIVTNKQPSAVVSTQLE